VPRPVAHLLLPLAAAVAALAGCASTAPHTMGAAAIGSGVALGAAAASRSAGGCWAVCTDGWVCNPASGWCEKPKVTLPADCLPNGASSDPRCTPWPAPTVTGQGGAAPSGSGAGYAPATTRPPPPPNESSPGGPPRP